MDTMTTIREILWEKHEISAEKVATASTMDDLGLDSLAATELICELEDRLAVDLGDDVDEAKTIGELIGYVDKIR